MGRVGLVTLALLASSVPALGLCGAMEAPMDPCAMAATHDMGPCADELAPATSCCDPGATGGAVEVVLKRHDEHMALPVVADSTFASGARELESARPAPLEPPPPRPAPYRLFSALLL